MEENRNEMQVAEANAAEIERRVREEVQRVHAQWEQADADRERLAAMTEEEKSRYQLSRREAALDEREKLLVERELRAMALEQLAERNLPRELADALPYDSEERCLKGLDALEQAFRRAVQEGVDERLRGKAPKLGGVHNDAEGMSDAEYYRLNLR